MSQSHGFSDFVRKGELATPHSPLFEGAFGRLFRKLRPLAPPGSNDAAKLQQLKDLAGAMLEPAQFDPSLDNKKIPSGYTYFGQFIDHDITFDPTSSLQRQNDPNRLVNFRSPRFDLDCIYGRGPDDQPYLYDQAAGDATKPEGSHFLIGRTPSGELDLQRNDQGRAMIGDPRNDENIIVSQFQLMFLRFHNAMMKAVRRKNLSNREFFEKVQREVRWHYQWAVVNDFLKRIVGEKMWDKTRPSKDNPSKPRLRFYKPEKSAFIPVEFSAAAYRLGHSMIRGRYHLNTVLKDLRGDAGPIPIFLPPSTSPGTFDDLRGFRPLPQVWTIEWNRFFDLGGNELQLSRKIDAKLVTQLNAIPAGPGIENPLAFLNLVRGWRLGLPSGQSVAHAMGIKAINDNRHDPLWFYILKESEENGGEHLGPTGGTIVVEVFWGLLQADPLSYLNIRPDWKPWIPQAGSEFEIGDIIRFSGAPIDDAGLAPPTQ
ncbi:MAG TPA: heme peroxidase family protein [Thermoanaerobaculia bacterium]